MDVVLVVREILGIADPVVGESALPDFSLSTNDVTEGMRVAALEKLNCVLERYVVCGSDEKMDVFGHEDKGVNLKLAFSAISIESLEEEADIVFDDEQSSTLPS